MGEVSRRDVMRGIFGLGTVLATGGLLDPRATGIGESQGREPLWNPAGYLRNVIEHIDLQVG